MADDQDCDALERMPDTVHPGVVRQQESPVLIYVTPRGDLRVPGMGPAAGTVTRTFTLDEALGIAGGGTTIQMLPGKYYRPAQLTGIRGSPEHPVIIRGSSRNGIKTVHVCGSNAATPLYPNLPERTDWAYLKLIRCRNVVIEDLWVESCWPCFIYAEDCQNITLRNVHGQDGLYLLFSRGADAQGFVIENNAWKQDPTETMWRELAFEDLHHGLYGYYNGALFGSVDCRGEVTFRHNLVHHAFNGIRMSCSERNEAIKGQFNVDVQVYDNSFEFIRDNAVEPEATAINWHVRHNRFRNCHAPLSFHFLHGGWWYVYGNEGWFDERPGMWFQDNRGGTLLKLHSKEPFPDADKPWFVFNNSWLSRSYFLKKSATRHLTHVNNAYQFCDPSEYPACDCRNDRELVSGFPHDGAWSPTVRFDHDMSNKPFGDLERTHLQEKRGILAGDLGFVDPRRGDFQLTGPSPARGMGEPLVLRAGSDWAGEEDWPIASPDGRSPDIGARQGAELIRALPFRRYAERRRIA